MFSGVTPTGAFLSSDVYKNSFWPVYSVCFPCCSPSFWKFCKEYKNYILSQVWRSRSVTCPDLCNLKVWMQWLRWFSFYILGAEVKRLPNNLLLFHSFQRFNFSLYQSTLSIYGKNGSLQHRKMLWYPGDLTTGVWCRTKTHLTRSWHNLPTLKGLKQETHVGGNVCRHFTRHRFFVH